MPGSLWVFTSELENKGSKTHEYKKGKNPQKRF
jgi:hypothetical protein